MVQDIDKYAKLYEEVKKVFDMSVVNYIRKSTIGYFEIVETYEVVTVFAAHIYMKMRKLRNEEWRNESFIKT